MEGRGEEGKKSVLFCPWFCEEDLAGWSVLVVVICWGGGKRELRDEEEKERKSKVSSSLERREIFTQLDKLVPMCVKGILKKIGFFFLSDSKK